MEHNVGEPGQSPVAGAAQQGNVVRASARDVARTFDEVEFVLERRNKPADLLGIHAPVSVQHDDDVTGSRGESGPHRLAFAGLRLATTTTSRRRARATSTVLSRERPSTITTSSTYEGIRRRTQGRFMASLRVGITTLTEGPEWGDAAWELILRLRFGMDIGLTTQDLLLPQPQFGLSANRESTAISLEN